MWKLIYSFLFRVVHTTDVGEYNNSRAVGEIKAHSGLISPGPAVMPQVGKGLWVFPFMKCQPSATPRLVVTSFVGCCIGDNSDAKAERLHLRYLERSAVVDKTAPAPSKAARSQLAVGAPLGLCPCTSVPLTFALLAVLCSIFSGWKISCCNNAS